MRAALVFVFGSGWWVPWHVAILLLVGVPSAFLLHWMWHMEPGAGPQGGEAALAALLLALLALLIAALVSGLLWARAMPSPGARGYLMSVLGALAMWTCCAIAVLWLSELAASADASRTVQRVSTALLALLLAGALAGNLYALWRHHGSE
jgi:hypothetical protein